VVAQPVVAPPVAPPVAVPPLDPTPRVDHPAPTVWRADGPGTFRRTPWNTVGALPPRVDGDEVTFHLTGRGQRSELEPDVPTVQEGHQHDVTFSVRLDGPSPHQVIARWENDGAGHAPLDLRVRDGELVLHGGGGHPSGPRTFTRVLGSAPVGEWTQLRVRVRFSADPDKAGVSVWRDGRSVVDDERPRGGTLYPGQQSYLKVGLHRDRTVSRPSTARFGALHLEHGRAAAAAAERDASSGHDTSDTTHRSTGSSDHEERSPRSDTSHRRTSHEDDSRETRTSDRGSARHSQDDASEDRSGSGHDQDDRRRPSQHEDDRSGVSEHDASDRSSSHDRASEGHDAGDGGARDGGARDGGARDGGARDGGARDGGARDGGARESGDRAGRHGG
jgi:hypothetical protein